MKRTLHLLHGFTVILLLSGCLGYQLGGSRPEDIHSVHIAPVLNRSSESSIELEVTKALRARIQFDGRMQLRNSADAADAIIDVTITKSSVTPIAFRSDIGTTAQLYRLRIDAVATLKDAETGEILSSSETYGEATFPFESDLTSSKRNAHPRAAEDITRFLIDDLIERW
jgi:hypothetical protein